MECGSKFIRSTHFLETASAAEPVFVLLLFACVSVSVWVGGVTTRPTAAEHMYVSVSVEMRVLMPLLALVI